MLERNLQPGINSNIDRFYNLGKYDYETTFRYNELFKQIEENQEYRKTKNKNLRKRLLRERITGIWGSGSDAGLSYLEYNAQYQGDFKNDYEYQFNVKNSCGKNVVWFEGFTSHDHYVKSLCCRKQWCPVCGGKGGTVHDSRLHSILSRIDTKKYNLRQFVFTIPENLREKFKSRAGLSKLFKIVKRIIEKYFGEPFFDKRGHVKGYKLEKGVISYLHVFGETAGIFKPHINIHIVENKNVLLKLSSCVLDSIKKLWLKNLQKIDESIDVVDVHYSFRNSHRKNLHAIKYMCRPWSSDDFAAIDDQDLKKMLVVEMSGFQYLRFWGAMSNKKYSDEMELSEITEQTEEKIGEKLIPLFISPFNFDGWKNRLIRIDDGLFKIIGGQGDESKKCETDTARNR